MSASGVPVSRYPKHPGFGPHYHYRKAGDPADRFYSKDEPGVWFPVAVAAARDAVIAAAIAVKVNSDEFFNPTVIALDNALAALEGGQA